MEATGRPRASVWSAPLVVLAAILYVVVLYGAYYLAAGRGPSFGAFIGPLIMFPLMHYWGASERRKNLVDEPPGAILALLEPELKQAGLPNVALRYVHGGEGSSYPRPYPMSNVVSLSKRICDEWSGRALAWSVKTDALASNNFYRKVLVGAAIFGPLAFYALGLGDRMDAPIILGVVLVAILLGFVYMGVAGYGHQLAADRRFTVSERDREAAKEALSFPYFDQEDRKKSNRWLYFPSRA